MIDTPRRRSDLISRLVDGEVAVLDRRADLIHQLNQTAGFIWQQCDGRATPRELAARLVEAFEVDLDIAASSVSAALEQFDKLGLLEGARD